MTTTASSWAKRCNDEATVGARLRLALTYTVAISMGGTQGTPLHLLHTPSSLPRPFICWQQSLQQQKQLLAIPDIPGCSPHVKHCPIYPDPPAYAALDGERSSKLMRPSILAAVTPRCVVCILCARSVSHLCLQNTMIMLVMMIIIIITHDDRMPCMCGCRSGPQPQPCQCLMMTVTTLHA